MKLDQYSILRARIEQAIAELQKLKPDDLQSVTDIEVTAQDLLNCATRLGALLEYNKPKPSIDAKEVFDSIFGGNK